MHVKIYLPWMLRLILSTTRDYFQAFPALFISKLFLGEVIVSCLLYDDTLLSGIDVPRLFFQKMYTMTFLLQPPRLLSLSIDEIVRPRHNSNTISRVITCVNKWYVWLVKYEGKWSLWISDVINRRWCPYHVLFVSVYVSIFLLMSIFPLPRLLRPPAI